MLQRNRVSMRQLLLLLIIIIPGGKYLSLPALMAKEVGRDSYLCFLILFAVDFVLLIFILWATSINKGKLNLYEILCNSIGKIVSKVLFAIFALLFIARVCVLLVNSIDLFSSTFSVQTNWIAYILPICACIGFLIYKGANCLGRVTEMLFFIIMLAIVCIIAFSASRAEFENLLPFLDDGFGKVLKNSPNYTAWFGEVGFLMFFLDLSKAEKVKKGYFFIAFGVGVVICLVLDILFLALFGSLAPFNDLAMSKVSQFSIYLSSSGRLDWLWLSIWLVSLFIKVALMCFCAMRSISFLLGKKEEKFPWLSLILVLAPLIILPPFIDIQKTYYHYFGKGKGRYVFWIVQYLLPMLLPLFTFIASKKVKTPPDKAITEGKDKLVTVKGKECNNDLA